MKPSEWFDLFCALRGTNPRPQPWQTEMVDRLWARRLERAKGKKPRAKGSSTFAVGIKHRSVGCSWAQRPDPVILIIDEVLPHADTLRALEMVRVIELKPRSAGMSTLAKQIAEAKEPPAPEKKAHEPFYAKFQPKRRLQ